MLNTLRSLWARGAEKTAAWIDRSLQGTHDHYSWFLPEKIGVCTDFLLDLFYSGINTTETQSVALKSLPEDAIIIYVSKFKSRFEYLYYYTRYKKEKFPFPQIGLEYRILAWQPFRRILRILFAHIDHLIKHKRLPDPYGGGYIQRELSAGRAGFLTLVEPKGFYGRFVKEKTDPVQYLIALQKLTPQPVYLVPQLMFFGKKSRKQSAFYIKDLLFGTELNPGPVRKVITLFKRPEKIFVEVSKPVSLQAFLSRHEAANTTAEHLSLLLRRNLLRQINRHRQNITGPVLKTRQELKESILTNERLQRFMNHYASSRNLPIQKIHKEADEYLEEIAANYSAAMIRFLEVVLRWMIRVMFDGIIINDEVLSKIKFKSLKGPLVLIPCHKSHIDYLILSYILYQNNLQCPHIAAGKNLSFWPLGPIFRSGGAFFIRRTFRGAVLYARIFAEYVHKMLEEGFSIEFFIEGTRSRTGKLIPPKLGLLSILLNAYKNGACDDLIFVPVYVGYDRVLEESAYLDELEGGQKASEDLSQLIRARKFLKKRYGKIYVRFSDPISLNKLLTREHFRFDGMTQKDQNTFCRDLGQRIVNAIDQNTVVTPHALVASAILNITSSVFSYGAIMDMVKMYLNYLDYQDATLSDTLLLDFAYAVESALDDYEQRKLIEKVTQEKHASPEKIQYRINENRRPGLEYYKNSCVTHFVPLAYTALSILKKDAFQFRAADIFSDYAFIQDLFKNEFFQDIMRTPEYSVRKSLKAFIDEAAIVPHPTLPDTYNITSAGLRSLKSFSNFLTSYMESYWIAIQFFVENQGNGLSPKERLKKIHSTGAAMYKNSEIHRKEALSKMNFANAVDTFLSNGLQSPGRQVQLDTTATEIQGYLSVLRA